MSIDEKSKADARLLFAKFLDAIQRFLAVRRQAGVKDKATCVIQWSVEKFAAKDSREITEKGLTPYEVVHGKPHNCILHEGWTGIFYHIAGVGSSTNKWDNTNAKIGVGNDATAPADTQTGLIGASKLYKGMNATYPQKSGDHDLVFQSDFVSGEAEFAWNEESITNNTDDTGVNLQRQNTSLGTKPAGQTWRVTGTITWT
jgi:hypothetical protein